MQVVDGMKVVHGMKIGVVQPYLGGMETGDPAVIASRAEQLGFASYWLGDHPVAPEGFTDEYPAQRPGDPPPTHLLSFPDPFVALGRASAATTSISLGTAITQILGRNPFITAKQVATLDHFSGGRFLFGIGLGWSKIQCEILGGDWRRRWKQAEESIEVMKKLWTGDYVTYKGDYFEFSPVTCRPTPARKPHPPILIGSVTSKAVFRRIGRWGDGWLPFLENPDQLAYGKSEITLAAQQAGRDPSSMMWCFMAPAGTNRSRSELAEFAKAGADHAVLNLQGRTQNDLLQELEELAGAVLF